MLTLSIFGGIMFESIAFAMGPTPGAGGQAGGTDMLVQFVPLILMFAIFWFLLIRPQQKRAKEHKLMLENLKRGDHVITSGGMVGRILELDSDSMLLECGESKLRMTRGAIATLYDPKAGKAAEKPAQKPAQAKDEKKEVKNEEKSEEKKEEKQD